MENRFNEKVIGGSQIGAILGLSPFQTPLDIYNQLINNNEKQQEDNKYFKAGRKLESVVAEYYSEETNRIITIPENKTIIHSQYPFLVSSVDRIINNNGILECKTTQLKWEKIPEYYLAQLYWYMGMYGFDFGSVAWLERGLDFDFRDFEFDKNIYDSLIEEAVKFWDNHIIKQIPPDPINAEDVKKYFKKQTEGKILITVPETYNLISDLKNIKKQISELEKQEKDLQNKLLPVLKDVEIVQDESENILLTYRKDKDGEIFDSKAFAKDEPELYNKYLKIKIGSRKLLIK